MGMFETLAEKLKKMKKTEETEVTFKPFNEEAEEPVEAEVPAIEEPAPKKPVAPMIANGDQDSNIELKLVCPEEFGDVSSIADHLLAGCTVVLNLEKLERDTIIRMLDFLNGVTYSTGGEIKNVSKSTFIITPHNVDVSDD